MGKWAVFAGLLFMSLNVRAADIDVDRAPKNIFDACQVVEERSDGTQQYIFDNAFCRGYVYGLWSRSNACIGAQRLYDLVLIFNAFVRKNPVWRTRNPQDALEAALLEAFPCPAKP